MLTGICPGDHKQVRLTKAQDSHPGCVGCYSGKSADEHKIRECLKGTIMSPDSKSRLFSRSADRIATNPIAPVGGCWAYNISIGMVEGW